MEINDHSTTTEDRMLQTQREIGRLDGQIIEVRREYKSFTEDYDIDIITDCSTGITGVLGIT